MKGEFYRVLTTTVFNPSFRSGFRRGIWSIRQFRIGLPIVVHQAPDPFKNYFGLAPMSVDIPLLRVHGLSDTRIITLLLKASQLTRLPKLAADETFIACKKCYGSSWLNIAAKIDLQPKRAVCVQCGSEIKVVRVDHAAGHA